MDTLKKDTDKNTTLRSRLAQWTMESSQIMRKDMQDTLENSAEVWPGSNHEMSENFTKISREMDKSHVKSQEKYLKGFRKIEKIQEDMTNFV